MASSPDQELEELRREVDRIDRAMVELLAERLRVVREIARIKRTAAAGQPAIRPGREAVILRRLVEQAGARFPAGTLVRMWRELLAATTRAQAPSGDRRLRAAGSARSCGTSPATISARRPRSSAPPAGRTRCGWSPTATPTSPSCRCRRRASPGGRACSTRSVRPLRVVARLPFGPAGPQLDGSGAMVVGAIEPEPSGADLSLLAAGDAGRGRPRPAARRPGARPSWRRACWRPCASAAAARPTLHLIELDGFVTAADPPLAARPGPGPRAGLAQRVARRLCPSPRRRRLTRGAPAAPQPR